MLPENNNVPSNNAAAAAAVDTSECATAGSSGAGVSRCGNSTCCVYISDFDASFCIDV